MTRVKERKRNDNREATGRNINNNLFNKLTFSRCSPLWRETSERARAARASAVWLMEAAKAFPPQPVDLAAVPRLLRLCCCFDFFSSVSLMLLFLINWENLSLLLSFLIRTRNFFRPRPRTLRLLAISRHTQKNNTQHRAHKTWVEELLVESQSNIKISSRF